MNINAVMHMRKTKQNIISLTVFVQKGKSYLMSITT